MRKRRRWLIFIVGPALILIALAYQLIEPRSHILLPPRASNGVEYVLYAHVPDACQNGGCPALYLLDGERWISVFARMDDALTAAHEMQPVVIVGVGYRDVLNTSNLRERDFTPAFGHTPDATGGADAYIGALRNDIIPYAEAHLPIEGAPRAIAGHSYGALLATYALAKAPELFGGYLIMSPELSFDDGAIFNHSFSPASGDRTVFLAAETARGETSAMARDVGRLTTLLLTDEHLNVSRSVMIDTTRDSMVEPAARAGMVALFSSGTL